MVLLASNALSKVNKIQIYGDKFFFQNIYLAGSKVFWGTLNCLKSQKFLAGARFSNLDFVKNGFVRGKMFLFFFPESEFSFFWFGLW